MPINFFSPRSAAERYAKGRVNFHPVIIERVKQLLSLQGSVHAALDVGCGTGLSTVALKEVAQRVVGVDLSEAMLALALRSERVTYAAASAERLPFFDGQFDLMTLSQSFHWLDREKFLKEASRVLRPGGWLVIYDNYFPGRMEGREDFETWFRSNYPKRFPAPARANIAFGEGEAKRAGFELLGNEQFLNSIRLSHSRLVDFLLTHSNVIAAVEFGEEDIDESRRWLADGIGPFFGEEDDAAFVFTGIIWHLRRDGG